MADQPQDKPFLDLSDDDAKRRTFRKLVTGLILCNALVFVLAMFSTLPEALQMAIDLETESIPPWRVGVEVAVGLFLLGTLVWAYYQLWHYERSGVVKLAVVVATPAFLVETLPHIYTPFVGFMNDLFGVAVGMVLFMGWAWPEIFGQRLPKHTSHDTANRDGM